MLKSASSHIIEQVLHRLGFAIVIAAAAVVAAIVTGGSVIAAAVAAAVAVGVLGLVLERRDQRSPEREPQAGRRPGEPWSFAYRWKVEGSVDLMGIYDKLREQGSVTDLESRSQEKIVAVGGSQLRSRLFGGYFVDPRSLPVRITLEAARNADGSSSLAVEIRDRFGIAIRDRALEERYAQAAEIVRSTVEPRRGAAGRSSSDGRD